MTLFHHFFKVEGLELVVKFENQRAIYADDQKKIWTGFNRLVDMMNEMETVECTGEADCNRKKTRIAEGYHDDFNVQGKYKSRIS